MLDYTITVNENIEECRRFVETNHYTKTYGRGGKYYFGLYLDNVLVGVSIWRTPNGRLTFRIFKDEFNNKFILDLTRMVLNNDMPKNSESWFLSRNIKWLKKKDIKYLITYADTYENHSGIIYQATNWIKYGKGGDGSRIYYKNEDDTLILKSTRWISHLRKKGQLDSVINNIIKVKVNGKFRYIYPLKIKRKKFLKDNKVLINKYELEHSILLKMINI